MRLYTKIRAAVLGITIAVGALGGGLALQVTNAAPATAAIGSWSNTLYYGGYPVYSKYYSHIPAGGDADYANVYVGSNGYPVYFADIDKTLGFVNVNNGGSADHRIWNLYRDLGFEGGWAGVPFSPIYIGNNNDGRGSYGYQYYIKPGTCDLRYLVGYFYGGGVGAASVPHYFC